MSHNIHVWSHCNCPVRKIINTKYNRLWRRIFGEPRFCRVESSDYEVRSALGIPSLDCFVRRRRLRYLSHLSAVNLPALRALLQAADGRGRRMPWIVLILDDLSVLRDALPRILCSLPPPAVDAAPYWEIASKFPKEWAEIVASYSTSYDDPARCRRPAHQDPHGRAFTCQLCPHWQFSSSKGLAQHQRIARGQRTPVSDFVGDWRTCPVCKTTFASRVHLVNHLAEKRVRSKLRSTTCGAEFLSHSPPKVDMSLLATLVAIDRRERQEARKQGRTRPTVS